MTTTHSTSSRRRSANFVFLLAALLCLLFAGTARGQDDPYGTTIVRGYVTATSSAMAQSLASSYRFVTTTLRNNIVVTNESAALSGLGTAQDYAIVDDLQRTALPTNATALPFYATAIMVAYKFTNGPASYTNASDLLLLDLPTLARIFTGEVTTWDDAAITALNGPSRYTYSSELQANPITLVVRSDSSPVNRVLTRALASVSATFNSMFGVTDQPNWSVSPATFAQVSGASAVMSYINANVNSLGVIEWPAWSGTTYAVLRNRANGNNLPTTTSIQRIMIDSASRYSVANNYIANLNDSNSGSWPLVMMSYLVVPNPFPFSSAKPCANPRDLLKWFAWVLSNQQSSSALTTAGYTPLHYSISKRSTDAAGGIRCSNSSSVTVNYLLGSGATLPLVAYQGWIQEYSNNVKPSVPLSYTGTGSGTGITDITAYNTDISGSDSILTAAQYNNTDLQMLPAIAAAVVMVYNLPELNQTLVFSREVLAQIYLGQITMWNDSRIQADNLGITNLPAQPIIIIGRSDSSGTTTVFTGALSLFSPAFNASVGSTGVVNWGNRTGIAGNPAPKNFIDNSRYLIGAGNEGVVALIKSTSYTLGYAVNADALLVNLPFAKMRNKAGNIVEANPTTIEAALVEYADAFNERFTASIQDGSSANAWPMATYSYFLVHLNSMTECAKAKALLDFIIWTQTSSSPISIAAALGYTVTPIAVRRRFLLTLSQVTCNGETAFSFVPCLSDGVICSNHGTCLDGKCTCDVGYSGSQCGDTVDSSSSNDGLVIGLAVGLPVGLLALCCLILIFVLFGFMYWRKGRQQELLLADEWSDYSSDGTEMDSISASSSSSRNSNRSSSSMDLKRDLSFTDLEQLHLSYEPKNLTFGQGPNSKFPVDEEVHDKIIITNNGTSSRKFVFYVPAEDETLRTRLHPGAGVVKPGRSVEINVSCTLLMTTKVNRHIKLELEGLGKHLITIKLLGELSTKLDPNDIITEATPLGVGAFGSVYKAGYRGQEVAAKVLNSQLNNKQIEEFNREVSILNRLRCPYVINFIGASHVPGKRCIVTELCSSGSVADLVFSDRNFNYVLVLKFALDMAKAIAFLHENGVLHRDVKPENFLVVSVSAKAGVCCKIADFGTSRSIATAREMLNHTAALGTPLYMAPEVLEHQPYSAKIDVYSFGVVLWVLYTRREPYTELKRQWDVPRYVIKGKRPQIPHHCPKGYADLITKCWAHNAEERPDMVDVVKAIERLFEAERGMSKRGRGDVDDARSSEKPDDYRERKGMRTWDGDKNVMLGQSDSEDSDKTSKKKKGSKGRKSMAIGEDL